jgi:hypothetical protein
MWKLRDDRRAASSSLFAWRLAAQLQAQLVVNPMRLLQIDLPALTAQKNMDAPVAIPNARLADLFDAGFKAGLLVAARFVMIG